MSRDQYTLSDPTKLYADIDRHDQSQPGPGLDANLDDRRPTSARTPIAAAGGSPGARRSSPAATRASARAAAIAFAREGADVAICYLPEEEEDAERIVGAHRGGRAQAVAAPRRHPRPGLLPRPRRADAVEGLGGLDILVNNGGKQQAQSTTSTTLTDEQFDETFKTNVYAMFWITKAALPHLRPGRTIINTTSIQAYEPVRDLWTTPRPRPPSTPSPRGWRSSSRPRASA